MTTPSDMLTSLAQRCGVATEYWDWKGQHVVVSAEAIRSVLAALGIDAADDTRAQDAHWQLDDAPWRQVLPPTVVMRVGWTPWVSVHVPDGASVTVRIELERGGTRRAEQVDHWVDPRTVDGTRIGRATFELPGDLPEGYHRLVADVGGSLPAPLDGSSTTATLIVTPPALRLPSSLAERPAAGIACQLYQVRSRESWGVGDLHDLGALAEMSAREFGSDFVVVNPLHAAEPTVPMEPSPYLPSTRRFGNPVYLSVPEAAHLADVADTSIIDELAGAAAPLNGSDTIERDAAWQVKRAALWELREGLKAGRRGQDFARYCEREGEGLITFATWCALAETFGGDWSHWPEEYRDSTSMAVDAFRREHADLVDFHCLLQWLLDRQTGQAQRQALAAGMRIGLVKDLAVGVSPHGADTWGLGDALAQGVTVGAPPDQFNQLGQNWSQPPWRPDELARTGYQAFRDMVHAVLADSGGVRIDHIIGLFRLWWIPEGGSPADGTYVRYDHEALIGIVVLEAHRAGAVVVGEDLGVVEPSARDYLRERGILGTSIMWFEWDEQARPLAPEAYRPLCLSSVTTHDLPPTAGYLAFEHVAIRERLGLLTRTIAEERAAEEASVATMVDMLVGRGLLPAAPEDRSLPDVVLAMHRYLSDTPSVLRAASLSDLVLDRRAINQPGTHDEYPNWRVALTNSAGSLVFLEGVPLQPYAREIARALLPGAAEGPVRP